MPSIPAKASLMEVFLENEFSQDQNKKMDEDSEREKEVKYFERPEEDVNSITNDPTISYSKIRFKSPNGKQWNKEKETSATREENEIDYTSIKFGAIYV